MALIKCTECGNPVSDKANNCPHCGCPVEPDVEAKKCPECVQDVLEENKSSTKVDEIVQKAEKIQQTESKKGSGIPMLIISIILLALQIMSMIGNIMSGDGLPGIGMVGLGYYAIGIIGIILFFVAIGRIKRRSSDS